MSHRLLLGLLSVLSLGEPFFLSNMRRCLGTVALVPHSVFCSGPTEWRRLAMHPTEGGKEKYQPYSLVRAVGYKFGTPRQPMVLSIAGTGSEDSRPFSSSVFKDPTLVAEEDIEPPAVVDIMRVLPDSVRVVPPLKAGEAGEEGDTGKGTSAGSVGEGSFVDIFRASAPYIRTHRGATMVVHMGGGVLEGPGFLGLMDDLGLLSLLGVHLVLVCGARPQISSLLSQAGIKEEFRDGLRITSPEALKAIKAAAGFVRIEVESALTRRALGGGGRGINVSGGNFYSAQPIGVRGGVDFGCTGEVRKVEVDKIKSRLADGGVVQLTCTGYSASGEVFNVDSRDLAAECASQLGATKLIFVVEGAHFEDTGT
ncbi:unnamed protein product, partial [Discosporangium mesarthrocarpum]